MRKETFFKIFLVILLLGLSCYMVYKHGYDSGYKSGYNLGYSKGYAERNKLAEKEFSDAVAMNTKTETKIIYEKIPYNGSDVQVRTEPPKVTVSVNGKKQEIKQHSETADLAVKTESAVKIRIPERKWKFGIGTDGKKATYMLSAPIKDSVGVWIAGNKQKVMGGITISF